jgi:putative ABC transport system permease protein
VKNVSVSSRVPGEWKEIRMVKLKTIGNTEDLKQSYLIGADKDFLKTFEIKLLKGRNFSSPNDSANIIINETAARMLGIEDPSGQVVEMPMMSRGSEFTQLNPENIPFTARVIGIVKDFHFQSLREKIAPLVLAYNDNPIHVIDYYTARIDSRDIQATLEKLKAVMLSVNKEDPFEFHFP